jgi:hypothetical protein
MRLTSALMFLIPKRFSAWLAVTASPDFNAVNSLWVLVPWLMLYVVICFSLMLYCSHSYNNITLLFDQGQVILVFNLAKLFGCVVFDQALLDHGDQIAMVICYNESHRAIAPCPFVLELCEPCSMLLVLGFKHRPRSTQVCQFTHALSPIW